MFTWICPKCGREVPPSYEACPDCAAREKAAGQSAEAAATAQPAPTPPPAPATPSPAAYTSAAPPSPAQYAAEPPRAGLPTWLLAILFAFAFVGLGGGVYWAINYFKGGTQAASAPAAATAAPAQTSAAPNPLQKYVEVSGIRFVESPAHQTEARFVVINHSDADITDLSGTVKIWGRTAKAEEEPAGNFSFKLPSLNPNESKETTAPLDSKLKIYELPDWQNITTQVRITSPQ